MIGCGSGGDDAESWTGVCGGVGAVVGVDVAFASTVCACQHQECSGGICGFFLVSGPFYVHFSGCVCGVVGEVGSEVLLGAEA